MDTKLRDKDGRRVFEGDILETDYEWDEFKYSEEGDALGFVKEHQSKRRWKVKWWSGTMGINYDEYATMYTGFVVDLIYCEEKEWELDHWKGTEFERSREESYCHHFNRPLGQKYDFTNFGTNGGVQTEYATKILEA